MEGRLVFKGCTVLDAQGRVGHPLAVVVEGGRISQVAPDEVVPVLPGDWEVACRGRALMPGRVDGHARPLEAWLGGQPNVPLTARDLRALSAHALALAVRRGVTFVDLQVTGLCPETDVVLSALTESALRVGAGVCVSHLPLGGATADSVAASVAFSDGAGGALRTAIALGEPRGGNLGLWKDAAQQAIEKGVGARISWPLNEQGAAEQVAQLGPLHPGSVVAAPGANMSSRSASILQAAGAVVAVDRRPETAMGLREAEGERLSAMAQAPFILGTFLDDSLQGATARCLSEGDPRGAGKSPDAPQVASKLEELLLAAPARWCSSVLSVPFGTVEVGARADLVLYDAVPAGPREPWRTLLASVAWTVVNGRVVVREGQLVGPDAVALAAEAAAVIRAHT